MKKLTTGIILFSLLLLSLLPAYAEDCIQAIHPGAAILTETTCVCEGETATVIDDAGILFLCITQSRSDGTSYLVVDRAGPLLQGEDAPVVSFTEDHELCWQYDLIGYTASFRSRKTASGWVDVSCELIFSSADGTKEVIRLSYEDGKLFHPHTLYAADGSILAETAYTPIPASGREQLFTLNGMTIGSETIWDPYMQNWPGTDWMQAASAELLPACEYTASQWDSEGLRIIARKPSGSLFFAGITYDSENGYSVCESAALPDDTVFDGSSVPGSLRFPGGMQLHLAPSAPGLWGVDLIYADEFTLIAALRHQAHWAGDSLYYSLCSRSLFGTLPFSDIRAMDWAQVLAVSSVNDVLAMVDPEDWAVVSNPDPSDRLHLRAEPSVSSQSLGSFINGTPVHILEEDGLWAHVKLGPMTGWMMRVYLAAGNEQTEVTSAMPEFALADGLACAALMDAPDGKAISVMNRPEHLLLQLGSSADGAWACIWDPEAGQCGWVRRSELSGGNG